MHNTPSARLLKALSLEALPYVPRATISRRPRSFADGVLAELHQINSGAMAPLQVSSRALVEATARHLAAGAVSNQAPAASYSGAQPGSLPGAPGFHPSTSTAAGGALHRQQIIDERVVDAIGCFAAMLCLAAAAIAIMGLA